METLKKALCFLHSSLQTRIIHAFLISFYNNMHFMFPPPLHVRRVFVPYTHFLFCLLHSMHEFVLCYFWRRRHTHIAHIVSAGHVQCDEHATALPSHLVTQTVYGFLDFTTTIGNTVMVFSPQSSPAPGSYLYNI